MAESETPKTRRRPLVRLGIFLISHSLLVSVVCCTAGVLALLLLPVLAKNTYISENALMPGSANAMLSSEDISEAHRFMNDLTGLNLKTGETGIESSRLIARYMSDLGADVNYHKFHPQPNQFRPLHFFSNSDSRIIQENIGCSSHGVNTVGIIRAPRGDGKEAIVLVTPYNSHKIDLAEALSLAIAYSVFSLLTRVTWLAKDIIWLAADSKYGEYTSVSAWLRDYQTPVFGDFEKPYSEICYESNACHGLKESEITERKISDVFRRAGTMAAALVIKVSDGNKQADGTLSIYAEASNGQMPNLDLINIVNNLAVHRQGLQVKVEKLLSLLDSKWLRILGEVFESVGNIARSLNPQWKFGIPAADYMEGAATLTSSLYYQALGVPTGSHGAFRDYQVDAITLEISPKVALNNKIKQTEFLQRGGRLIEGVIRSVNNLLEKFHQSFFLYLLTSPSKFVSVGVYMIAFALLVAPLPIVAASLYSDANKWDSSLKKHDPTSSPKSADDERRNILRSWKWLYAAKQVFIIHSWGVIVSLLPYLICQMPNWMSKVLTWLILGSPIIDADASQSQKREWAILKSVTISAAFIGLCLMSVINFATAEIGALLLVPMCLLAHPLRLDVRAHSLKAFTRAGSNLVLGFIGFPPAAFFVLKGSFEGFESVNISDFWNWIESLWAWNSATYLYIGMVHLPCWALCIWILLHPC
ncbi:glycosylphosphatidylinositol anchor attachment 1 protein [Vitis riparia]|uniref:glycosylphosphatidylinositol anchor attachment 1 protein n=1 Tax=Vitis riparia TaxID=96939 RepID=UPI00155AB365|nr:glycosylphosphatidylinositol anchor attachment 1 protein [Vitis riparia]